MISRVLEALLVAVIQWIVCFALLTIIDRSYPDVKGWQFALYVFLILAAVLFIWRGL